MGKVNQLWQDERDELWDRFFNEYLDNLSSSRLSVTSIDAASQYADDMLEEMDNDASKGD
jgi:hypothetical protein